LRKVFVEIHLEIQRARTKIGHKEQKLEIARTKTKMRTKP